ncbi:hypothetical protein K457DRAFT_515947 [Linnemannia elongata AG-77]|uniref:Uncharacterized protein n=1 Tax=Linnemannia elongata AG-77 TaxID=1314771 RepID=A0A197JW90_9FUNG|nr:hypothetical protein K457DRAFT_515947 [Linnemannia elongata AG-77]
MEIPVSSRAKPDHIAWALDKKKGEEHVTFQTFVWWRPQCQKAHPRHPCHPSTLSVQLARSTQEILSTNWRRHHPTHLGTDSPQSTPATPSTALSRKPPGIEFHSEELLHRRICPIIME